MKQRELLSHRFRYALLFAADLHAKQFRKGSDIPYFSHLMAVTAIVLEDGGDEDQAIAALLHDAVEDQGGLITLDIIRANFGDRVARIVEGCSDSIQAPKPPWRERKERYLQHLREADQDVMRVSLADKVHNARSILTDLRQNGDQVWGWFNGGKEGTLWYYRSLVDVFEDKFSSPLVEDLSRVVYEIVEIAGEQQ